MFTCNGLRMAVLWMLALAVLTGSRHVSAKAETDVTGGTQAQVLPARHRNLRVRTAKSFPRAAFVQPMPSRSAGKRIWMAPLIVQQIAGRAGHAPNLLRFGAIAGEDTAHASLEERRLTVYWDAARVRLGGQWRQQQIYLWFYPPAHSDGSLRWRGFRQTLDARGFVLVWEALSSEATCRVFFVTKSLERAAARRFGTPLPGRQYAIEPSMKDHPEVVVARLVPKGPQPMGPYVYVAHPSLDITTMKCRCEPSQVAEFSMSLRYQLAPLDRLPAALLRGGASQAAELPVAPAPLAGILRLPPMM